MNENNQANEMIESEITENETTQNVENTEALEAAENTASPISMEDAILEEENPMAAKRRKWSAFVEGPAADFFTGYKLEKMMIDDGSGNKAKFSRTKDEGIKVEYTSAVLL